MFVYVCERAHVDTNMSAVRGWGKVREPKEQTKRYLKTALFAILGLSTVIADSLSSIFNCGVALICPVCGWTWTL